MDKIEVRSTQVQNVPLVQLSVNGASAFRTTAAARQLAHLIIEEADVADANAGKR